MYERQVKHGDEPAPETTRIADRQTLSMLHRTLARVLPEDANDDDGIAAYQLERARVIESGFTGEYRAGANQTHVIAIGGVKAD